MSKKIIFNFALVLVVGVIPYYVLYVSQDNIITMEKIQAPLLAILFLGSAFLIYLNNKYRKQDLRHKWLWIFFMIVGILGLGYSGFVLYILFATNNILS